jgi:hypothetical protein
MTEEEMEIAMMKHARRRETFMKEGLNIQEAWKLADQMYDRDNDSQDDRRLCFECKKYNERYRTCPMIFDNKGNAQRPLRFTLQRCEWFELKGKK